MIIGSISEDKNIEKRVSITPEISKKYIDLGFEVQISENYAEHLGFVNSLYEDKGVKILSDRKKIIETSNIILQMGLLNDDDLSLLKQNQNYIGVLNAHMMDICQDME